jgi:hypothetical protein
MRMLLIGLFGVYSLAGCGEGSVLVDCEDCEESRNECSDCDPNDEWILLVAEDRDQSATLTIEFLEQENQVGQIGWHLTMDCPDVVELNKTPDELQDMLDDRDYNVVVDNIECVRWNVIYADGHWLCEGNDNTPYDAELITQTYFNWSGVSWSVDTWSDPEGDGCSAVACN